MLPEKEITRDLFRREHAHGACLRGIYTLITGERPVIQIPKQQPEPVQTLLRRCYGRHMRMLAAYEKHTSDPEFGPAFGRLVQQEREHCHRVLELLGSLQE